MHILIIRPGAIGDTLLTLPVIQALREHYGPAAHITLVGNTTVLPLAHASGIVDEIHDYQETRWSHLFLTESSRSIRDGKPDTIDIILKRTQLAICWLHNPAGIVEQNLRRAGIEQVIITSGRPDISTHRAMHIIAYLAETIGLTWQKPLHDISLPLPDITPQAETTRLIALHPGSGGASKCWPVECFAEVIYYLWQHHRAAVLVLAGPAEQERLVLLQSLLRAYPQPGQCEYLINSPLLTIAQRLQQCQCYIGNDSGLTHLAAMLGLPTLALFGPSDPIIWHPPGPSVTILHEQALKQLGVETVITKLTPLIS